MKALPAFLVATVVLAFTAGNLMSQFPGQGGVSPVEALKEMRATNAATLEKQEATLKALDAMTETAQQIKIFAKRA